MFLSELHNGALDNPGRRFFCGKYKLTRASRSCSFRFKLSFLPFFSGYHRVGRYFVITTKTISNASTKLFNRL